MTPHRRWAIVGLCFLGGVLAVLAAEVWLAQRATDALARRLSREIARAGAVDGDLRPALLRLQREQGLGMVALFDPEGGRVAEAGPLHGEGGHGVVFAARAGVRDLATGRELFHLVVHRDIQRGFVHSGLAGIAAALLAGLFLWLAGRGGEAAPASG